MNLLKEHQLFFGCKLDSKMREALAQARPGDRKYFEGEGAEFLQIIFVNGTEERWIGKVVKAGISSGDIEDIQRNIISILRRISPTIRTTASSIKIMVAGTGDEKVAVVPRAESNDDGPYIDY